MSMLLDLSRLRAGAEHIERRFEPADFDRAEGEFRIAGPVDLVVDFQKDAKKVRLIGKVATRLEVACSRCLEPFEIAVDASFDSLFLPASANTGEDETEVSGEDLGLSFYRDDAIDLGEVMREQFYLAMPMKPLCTSGCRGLCPICGTNWNRDECTCQAEWVDPRLEPLKRFRQ
jgi:uncharacterized protein